MLAESEILNLNKNFPLHYPHTECGCPHHKRNKECKVSLQMDGTHETVVNFHKTEIYVT